MRRIVFIILCMFWGCAILSAQNRSNQSLVSLINSIKSQSDQYFWDQYTHPNADTARTGALKRLILFIEAELDDKEQFTVEEIARYAEVISINRGSLKQCFAYIEKKTALDIKKGVTPQKRIVSTIDNSNQQSVPEQSSNTIPVEVSRPPEKFVADAFTLRLFEAKTFSNVYKLLTSMTSTGQVLQFGKLKDVEDYTSFDLILFDMSSQEIISILSAEDSSGTRTNMIFGTPDSLSNYPQSMTAVIWFIKK